MLYTFYILEVFLHFNIEFNAMLNNGKFF